MPCNSCDLFIALHWVTVYTCYVMFVQHYCQRNCQVLTLVWSISKPEPSKKTTLNLKGKQLAFTDNPFSWRDERLFNHCTQILRLYIFVQLRPTNLLWIVQRPFCEVVSWWLYAAVLCVHSLLVYLRPVMDTTEPHGVMTLLINGLTSGTGL